MRFMDTGIGREDDPRDVDGFTRLGLRRPPLLTAGVAAVTAVVGVGGLMAAAVLEALQRTPAARDGQWWRWLTAMLVQDGGWAGTLSNLLFLVALRAAVEQVVGRLPWVGAYLVAGLAGQVAGQFWQPVGAGNSVAVCGLAGVLAWRAADPDLPPWARPAALFWLGALLATWWPPLLLLGLAAGIAEPRLPHGARRLLLTAATALVAVVLIAVANLHGAALAAGLAVGAVVRPATRARGR